MRLCVCLLSFLAFVSALFVNADEKWADDTNVDDSGTCSGQRQQLSGITQGCTLSPLLFVVVMSVLMSDAVALLDTETKEAYNKGDLADITFADDTLLMGVAQNSLSAFLAAVATAGARYGMELRRQRMEGQEVAQSMALGQNSMARGGNRAACEAP